MKEYKVIEWAGILTKTFQESMRVYFEKPINEAAKEGWTVKFSNVSVITRGNGEKAALAMYAMLERDAKQSFEPDN